MTRMISSILSTVASGNELVTGIPYQPPKNMTCRHVIGESIRCVRLTRVATKGPLIIRVRWVATWHKIITRIKSRSEVNARLFYHFPPIHHLNMCGIFCCYNRQGDLASFRPKAIALSKLQRHRGPDWSGCHMAKDTILVHERLAIVGVGQWNLLPQQVVLT